MSRTLDTSEASAGERLDCWTKTVRDQIVPVTPDALAGGFARVAKSRRAQAPAGDTGVLVLEVTDR